MKALKRLVHFHNDSNKVTLLKADAYTEPCETSTMEILGPSWMSDVVLNTRLLKPYQISTM